MPTRKHNTQNNHKGALIPKVGAFPVRKEKLAITFTSQVDKPRITGLITSGKKKRPK